MERQFWIDKLEGLLLVLDNHRTYGAYPRSRRRDNSSN